MSMNALKHEKFLSSHAQVELFEIAHQMKLAEFSDEFIASAIKTAFQYEGVADLLKLWRDENDIQEKQEIIADIQELIDDCAIAASENFTSVKINDLEAIAKNIRMFKDNLLTIVNEHGGISKLAQITKIPQPSLSRFFNSNSMPHRTTLLKIAVALNLDAVKITLPWD